MADKKVDAATGEIQEEERWKIPDSYKKMLDEAVEEKKQEVEGFRGIVVHCKPVYNYQSVEFDWYVESQANFEALENVYSKMLEMLIRVSQNAPQKEANKPAAPVEEPASEKQKEILRNFHIDFKPDITKKQAHALIKKSMDQEIF